MSNVAFTRDEVILALDTLFFSEEKHLNADSEAIKELSRLLNFLPIVPKNKHTETFRSITGISKQISLFRLSKVKEKRNSHVGAMFYEVANDYFDDKERIHYIAEAIKRNVDFFNSSTFGAIEETYDFPEGALLSHLHRMLEIRDSKNITAVPICEVCHLDLSQVYKTVPGGFMQLHLTVEITDLDYRKAYKSSDFITVCPNCHAMLHQYRPWLTKETANEILY